MDRIVHKMLRSPNTDLSSGSWTCPVALQESRICSGRQVFLEKQFLSSPEFSIFFLIINNLDFFRKNIELISEVTFSKEIMNELKKIIIDDLLSEKFFDKNKLKADDFDLKFKELIDLININAPVKIIHKNKNESEVISIFNEIKSEIKQLELRSKVETLEDKVSMNLDENLYSELLSLRNQLKSG